jgi:hypothetical protein
MTTGIGHITGLMDFPPAAGATGSAIASSEVLGEDPRLALVIASPVALSAAWPTAVGLAIGDLPPKMRFALHC